MKIYLVRHGESKSNYDNKYGEPYFCGQLNVPLTEQGTESAQALVNYFTNKNIDYVYVSSLLRTQQTYEAIFPYNIPTTFTDLLKERSLGVFEGKYKKCHRTKPFINILMMIISKISVIALLKKHQKEKAIKMYLIE